MEELEEIIKAIDLMMVGCEIDYKELKEQPIASDFFDNYSNTRIVNSFLFNYSKIQDKIGAKLFRKVLYVQKEIDSETLPMKDVLNILEKLQIIESVYEWDRIREIRNNLSHEYPYCIDERIENIELAIEGYELLKKIYENIKKYCNLNRENK
ncbi:MAG: hypothetical protein NTW78_10885 [Campylobacterales bacterium]|nr:hypothetical protein [Campylobacterales bacterium]